ncbi:MAG: hypothetical protein KAH18_03710 [Psychromonas sp.]|nr:hypothetical protein [Psychromonas sp.]
MAVSSTYSNSHAKTTGNDNQKYDRSDIEHYKNTEKFYSSAINEYPVNVAKLNLFLILMPKGGDLHHHYSGSIYAECSGLTIMHLWVESASYLKL